MRYGILLCLALWALPAAAESFVIEQVGLRDPSADPRVVDVHVVEGRIAAIGAELELPEGTRRVDGRGKFLIPGLSDMHVQLTGLPDSYLSLLVRYGVTRVRDMGGDLFAVQELRRQVTSGAIVGPAILAAGPVVGQFPPNGIPFATPGEARTIVETIAALEADFVALAVAPSDEAYDELVTQAGRRGLPVVGPRDAGVTPTLVFRQAQALDPKTARVRFEGGDQRDRFLSSAHRSYWKRALEALGPEEFPPASDEPMTGTRLGELFVYPGSSVHDELAALVAKGRSPRQALVASTSRPAAFAGTEASEGRIAEGFAADLVLLAADPWEKIDNVRKIEAVVVDGRLLDRAALEAIEERAVAERDKPIVRNAIPRFYEMRYKLLKDRESAQALGRYLFVRGDYRHALEFLEPARETVGRRGTTGRRVRKRDPAREIGSGGPRGASRAMDELIFMTELLRSDRACSAFHDEAEALLAREARDADATVDLLERILRSSTRRGCEETTELFGARLEAIEESALSPYYTERLHALERLDAQQAEP